MQIEKEKWIGQTLLGHFQLSQVYFVFSLAGSVCGGGGDMLREVEVKEFVTFAKKLLLLFTCPFKVLSKVFFLSLLSLMTISLAHAKQAMKSLQACAD